MPEQEGDGKPTRVDSSVRVGKGAVVKDSALGAGANVTKVQSSSGPVVTSAGSGNAHVDSPKPDRTEHSTSLWTPGNILAGAVASVVGAGIIWLLVALGVFTHIGNMINTGKP